MTKTRKMLAFIKLTRIHHAIMAVLAVIAGSISSIPWIQIIDQYTKNIVLGSIVTILVEMSVFIFNDIFNLSEDIINDPDKPLVKKEISLNEAKIYGVLTLFSSIILSIFISFESFILILLAIITGMAYNITLKKTGFLGNLIVAFNTALPFYYGALLVYVFYEKKIVIFYTIAFLTALGREIIKGIRDIVGDKKAGIRTLPVILGLKKSGYIATFLIITAIILSILPLMLVKNIVGYLLFILPTDILLLYSSLSISFHPDIANASKHRKITLIAMFLGILGFAFSNI